MHRPARTSRRSTSPGVASAWVEVIRMLTVVFFAGLGSALASSAPNEDVVLGPFDAVAVGVILGSGVGYVLGGILARSTIASVDRVELHLREAHTEDILATGVGALAGALAASVTGWPLLLLNVRYVTFPVFGFYFVVLCLLGAKLARARRNDAVALLSRSGRSDLPGRSALLPRLLDTSIAIDGRVIEVVRAGFLPGTFVVCTPVLNELQTMSDSSDPVRRAKGRRGLEVLETLKREPGVFVEVIDDQVPAVEAVDAKLMRLAIDRDWSLITLDTNLARAAALAGVRVLNFHQLTLALRPAVASGDELTVLVSKSGREEHQGVGYLDDGTMIVIESARQLINQEIPVTVTSVLTTASGRMVFAKRTPSPASTPADSVAPPPTPTPTPAPTPTPSPTDTALPGEASAPVSPAPDSPALDSSAASASLDDEPSAPESTANVPAASENPAALTAPLPSPESALPPTPRAPSPLDVARRPPRRERSPRPHR